MKIKLGNRTPFARLLVASILILSGPQGFAQDWKRSIIISESEFKPYVGLSTPIQERREDNVTYRIVLFGNVSKVAGEPIIYGMMVGAQYFSENRKQWMTVSTNRAESLELTIDGRSIESCIPRGRGCIYRDTFSTLLTQELLERVKKEPVKVQFRGSFAEYTYTFEPAEVQLLLDAARDTAARLK